MKAKAVGPALSREQIEEGVKRLGDFMDTNKIGIVELLETVQDLCELEGEKAATDLNGLDAKNWTVLRDRVEHLIGLTRRDWREPAENSAGR